MKQWQEQAKVSGDQLLRMWLRGSLALFVLYFVWAYVPILIPFAVVAGGLGGLTLAIRALARRFDRRPPE